MLQSALLEKLSTSHKHSSASSMKTNPQKKISSLLKQFKLDLTTAMMIRQKPQSEEELSPYPSDLMVALVAHNNMKPALMKLVKKHLNFFKRVKLVTTGSTGRALGSLGLSVDHLVSSGPLGGDQEIGALITQKKVCAVLFFTDPLSSHPHAADVEALNRICCVHDCMFANNPSTARTLVYSLQHCPFALSRLLGVNPEMHRDSSIAQAYKDTQQKVISSISELKCRSTSECSTRSMSKFSSTKNAEGSIHSGQKLSSSSSEMKSLLKIQNQTSRRRSSSEIPELPSNLAEPEYIHMEKEGWSDMIGKVLEIASSTTSPFDGPPSEQYMSALEADLFSPVEEEAWA
jgi:methylglyoxal synthase